MGTLFNDGAFVEDNDLVGFADGGEAVCDDEDGAVGGEVVEGFLNEAFGNGIDAGGGLIENDKGRVFEKDAGNGHALFFALREAYTLFPDVGIETFREFVDEVPRAGPLESVADIIIGGIFAGEEEVVADGSFEEKRILRDVADALMNILEVEVSDIGPVDVDCPAGDIVGAHGKVGDGAFAGTGVADEGGHFAGGNGEFEIGKDGGPGGVLEGHVTKLNFEGAVGEAGGVFRAGDFNGGI